MKFIEKLFAGPFITRRLFLKISCMFTLFIVQSEKIWALFIERFPIRTVESDTFRFNPEDGRLTWKNGIEEPYFLVVDGLVKKPLRLSYEALKSLPQVTQISDFHCVEGWSVHDVNWGGFRFEVIVKDAMPLPEAKYVLFHSIGQTRSRPKGQDHYIESFPLSRLLDPAKKCLMALSMDSKELTQSHGGPLRVVSPYDMGYKNIKYVGKIEFVKQPRPGWWTLANSRYPIDAPVPKRRLRH